MNLLMTFKIKVKCKVTVELSKPNAFCVAYFTEVTAPILEIVRKIKQHGHRRFFSNQYFLSQKRACIFEHLVCKTYVRFWLASYHIQHSQLLDLEQACVSIQIEFILMQGNSNRFRIRYRLHRASFSVFHVSDFEKQ